MRQLERRDVVVFSVLLRSPPDHLTYAVTSALVEAFVPTRRLGILRRASLQGRSRINPLRPGLNRGKRGPCPLERGSHTYTRQELRRRKRLYQFSAQQAKATLL